MTKLLKLFGVILSFAPLVGMAQIVGERDTLSHLSKDYHLPSVDIYGHYLGIKAEQMSSYQIPISLVQKMPTLMGEVDLLKSIQKLPGVQNSNEGQAGILVRGGKYDQNQILMDGTLIYSAEHLKGFTSALNADMTDSILFYKGAFPARYGGQLSSVLDVALKDGDLKKIHAVLSLGTLSSHVQVGGPLKKDRTSFNIAARMSYFNLIMRPILENISDNADFVKPYANINYYDLTGKVTHHINFQHQLSAMFYIGHDTDDTEPSESSTFEQTSKPIYSDNLIVGNVVTNEAQTLSNSRENRWGNLLAAVKLNSQWTPELTSSARLSFSRFYSRLTNAQNETRRIYTAENAGEGGQTDVREKNLLNSLVSNKQNNHSDITDFTANAEFDYTGLENQQLRWGAKLSLINYSPLIDTKYHFEESKWDETTSKFMNTCTDRDSQIGSKSTVKSASVYIEDTFMPWTWLEMNTGIRYSLYATSGKSYVFP